MRFAYMGTPDPVAAPFAAATYPGYAPYRARGERSDPLPSASADYPWTLTADTLHGYYYRVKNIRFRIEYNIPGTDPILDPPESFDGTIDSAIIGEEILTLQDNFWRSFPLLNAQGTFQFGASSGPGHWGGDNGDSIVQILMNGNLALPPGSPAYYINHNDPANQWMPRFGAQTGGSSFASSCLQFSSWEGQYVSNFVRLGGSQFMGQPFSVDVNHLVGRVPDMFRVTLSAADYWEYRTAAGTEPIYDSATGAILRDPRTRKL